MEKDTIALGQIWPAQLELVAHWQNKGRGLPSGWPVAPVKSG
jgi:hypothetical protein